MVNALKRLIRRPLRGLIEVTQYNSRPFGDSFWYEGPNLWEPTVLVGLRDLLRPGDIAFDVGANFGGLTSAMARLVGPRGTVCSFEASPRIFNHLQANVVKQGHFNVACYNCAVFSRSNDRVKIYAGDHLNDSIYDHGNGNARQHAWVETLALDDFCDSFAMSPALLKVDIEGAEFDALQGAQRLISQARPYLILEQQPNDVRCLTFLRGQGYQAIDLNNYSLVRSVSDFPAKAGLRNVLFVHESKLASLPYELPVSRRLDRTLLQSDFSASQRTYKTRNPIRLEAGRYLIDVDFIASGVDNEVMCGIRVGGIVRFRYHAYSKLLAENYRDWVLDLSQSSDVELYIEFLNNTSDPSFRLSGARIEVLENLRQISRQLPIM